MNENPKSRATVFVQESGSGGGGGSAERLRQWNLDKSGTSRNSRLNGEAVRRYPFFSHSAAGPKGSHTHVETVSD